MLVEFSEKARFVHKQVQDFMDEHVAPNALLYHAQVEEGDRFESPAIMEEWKKRAKDLGLWNLFLPASENGAGLTNLEYAPIAEILGRYPTGGEMFNCSAPDTGNMEVLNHFASDEIKERWLDPLLAGEIRSSYLMTEPDVASSDATNIRCEIQRDAGEYVINGRKWWSSGAGHNNAKVAIVMGCTNPDAAPHERQSQVVVPFDTPGFRVVRNLTVMGYDHAPGAHCEIELKDVRVPVGNILLGEGRGFEIAQARLGPGRIHHCMRCIGTAEVALELMVKRAKERVAFGTPLIDKGSIRQDIARSRIEIDQARLMVFNAAHMMDTVGNKVARREIAAIKVIAPNMAQNVIERAMQVHGGAGMSGDTPLAEMWANQRSLRFADGPDEVHLETVCKQELRHYR
jgi:alkylation response protein AidB-like acyl-CoA dehydrogenase